MKKIPLTKGKVALVDDSDFESVSRFSWFAFWNGKRWYARTQMPNGRWVQMHRFIVGAALVDHANLDGLDNQRDNLRAATKSQNAANSCKRRGTASIFKGVSPRRGKWRAFIKNRHLGDFSEEREAAAAYDREALKAYGEFARLNLPSDSSGSILVAEASTKESL